MSNEIDSSEVAVCRNCKYYSALGQACKFGPPQIVVLPGPMAGSISLNSMWPLVQPDAWCFKHPGRCGPSVITIG